MIVRLRSLGECAIEIGVRRLGPDAERAFAVLLVLVLAGGRPVSRRWVLDLLWPGYPDEPRRHNLRQTFYKLRQFGVLLDGDRQSIVLAAGTVLSDLDDLLGAAAVSDETLLDARAPFGVFLAGYAPQFSPLFAAWLDEQRDLAHGRLRRALLAVLLDRRRRGAWHDVERVARRVLVLDPLNEEATLALAEATALAGSKSAAIGILDAYVAELGVAGADIRLPATVLRRRIAERLQLPPSLAAGEACFVGRRDTMALLHQQLQSAKSASGRACLLWGDTGMGKSRALSEFGKLAVLEGARVEVVGCHSRDEHHPLSVFMDLVPPLLALPGAIGCSPETLGYLRRLTEHDPAVDTPSPDTGEAELLFARVRQALFDLIDAVTGECCVVLGIEDVHWLDNVSWQVLEELMGWCASRRLLVVLTARDARVLAGPPRRSTDGLLVHRLPALDDAEALTLLSAVLGGDVTTMSRAFRDWCVHLAEGNPFFLRALAVQWLETGEMHVPTSLRVLVDERVDRLDAYALRALQACAVLGKNSTLERLAAVLEHRRYELLKSLSALEEQGLLASDGPRVPAKHELVAQAALSRLPDAARHLLHRLAAQTLEDEIKGAQAAALLWDCARHWQEAGEAGRALDLVRWCATRLVEVGLPGDAAEALEQGLALCRTPDEELDLLTRLRGTLEMSRQWGKLLEVLDRMDRTVAEASPVWAETREDNEILRLEAQWRIGMPALEVIERVQACTRNCEHPPQQLRAAILGMMFADNVCNDVEMEFFHGQARRLLTAPGVTEAAARQAQLVFHTSRGMLPAAIGHARRFIELQRATAEPAELAKSLRFAAQAFRRNGLFSDSEDALREALAIADKYRLPSQSLAAIESIIHTRLDQNDIDGAALWYRFAKRFGVAVDDEITDVSFQCLGARIYLELGHPELAIACVHTDLLSYSDSPVLRRRSATLSMYVRLAMSNGTTIGDAEIEKLHVAHIATRSWAGQDYPTFTLVTALLQRGNEGLARTLLSDYCQRERREAYPLPMYLAMLKQD